PGVDSDFYPAGSFTVDAFVNTISAGGSIVSHYEGGGILIPFVTNSYWELSIAGGKAVVSVRDHNGGGTSGLSVTGAKMIDDGIIHHVALVRDVAGAKLLLYVDGQLDASATLTPESDGPLMDE